MPINLPKSETPSVRPLDLYRMGISEYTTGILPIAVPTGKGKTHDLIEQAVESTQKRKTLIIIPQWKNIAEKNLRKKAAARKKTVCFVRSYTDCIRHCIKNNHWNLVDEQVRELVKNENSGKPLIRAMEQLKRAVDYRESENTIRQREYSFRSRLLKFWETRYPTVKARKAARDQARWLTDLYPFLLADQADIVVITAQRFVLPFQDFVRDSKLLYAHPTFQNSVIYLDESPEIYQVWLEYLCGMPLGMDLMKVLELVYNTLKSNQWDVPAEHRDPDKMKAFYQETKTVYERYHCIWKLKRRTTETIDISFSNGAFIETKFYPKGQKGQSRTYYLKQDPKEKRNWIQIDKEGTYCLLKDAVLDIYRWWNTLLNIIQDLARDRMEITGHDFSEEIGTVIDDFNIPESPQLDEEFDEEGKRRNMKSLIKRQIALPRPKYMFSTPDEKYDPTPFANGFRFFELIDSRNQDSRTMINCRATFCLPEAILGSISQTSLVFLVSATAEFDTPYHNFNWDYLKDFYEVLPKPGPFRDEFLDKQQQFLNDDARLFSRGKISVEYLPESPESKRALYNKRIDSHGTKQDCLPIPLWSKICQILEDAYPESKSKSKSDSDKCFYLRRTAFRLVRAFARYYNGPEQARSAVLFTMQSGAAKQEVLEQCLVEILAESPCLPDRYLQDETGARLPIKQLKENLTKHIHDFAEFVQGSKDYQDKIPTVQNRWSRGERVALFVSVKTAGTSVNLDYPIPDERMDQIVQVRPDAYPDEHGRYHKDIDFLYLDRLTHVIPRYDQGSVNLAEENRKYMEFSAILESLQYQKELTAKEARNLRQTYFSGYDTPLRNRTGFRLAYTEQFIQVLGRITRTAFRSPQTVILLDHEHLNHLEYDQTKHYSLGALSRYVLEECEQQGKREDQEIRISSRPRTLCQYNFAADKSRQVARRRKQLQNGIRNKNYRDSTKLDHIAQYDQLIYNPDVLFYDYSTLDSLDQLESVFEPDIGKYVRKFDLCERPYFESLDETTYWVVQQEGRESVLDLKRLQDLCEEPDPYACLQEEFRSQADNRHSLIPLDGTRGQFDRIMKNPDLYRCFEDHHWCTDPSHYGRGKYCLCPKEDQERMGKLGEVTAYVALTRVLSYDLQPMRDIPTFEDFDYELPGTDVVVDAKNYTDFSEDYWKRHSLKHVVEKASRDHKKHVIIPNVYRDHDNHPQLVSFASVRPEAWNGPDWDGDILFCPSLLNPDGTWNAENIMALKENLESWIS